MEPLKQLGINMSVENLEAYALSKGIKKSYSAMTESEKATLRYNYLMKTTADAQGDFARTSDSFANQQRILQLNFENLTASIGEKVLPTITDIITLINDVLTGGEKVSKWIEDNKQPLTLLAILIGTITTALIAYTIAQNALTIATTIATTASTAFGAVMAFITSPITLVVLAIGALIAIGYLLITNWEKVKETAIKVFNYIGNFVGSIINKIKEIFKGAFDIGNNLVKGLWNGINNAKDWILNKIKGFGKDVLNGLKDFFGIHSPSKLFQNEIGDNLILGVGVAFDKDSKLIDKQIKEFGDDVFNKMSNAVNLETGKMSFSGTSGSVSEILNANSQFTGNINNVLELDGEVVYSNQQTIKARKELQYGGV